MTKRVFAVMLAIAVMLCLCGCQLAKTEEEAPELGRLVGVFVTTEPLGALDAETVLNEYLSGGAKQDEIPQDHPGRVYAIKTEKTITGPDGKERKEYSYVFPGLEGMLLARFVMESPQGNYVTSQVSEGISDVNSRVGGSNEGISGTIWMAKGSGEAIYYMHPVYQNEAGVISLLPGQGIHVSADDGIQAKQSFHETTSVTEGGEEQNRTFEVEITIDFANPAETLRIIQMSEDHKIIDTAAFKSGDVPAEFAKNRSCEYMILEITGGEAVERSIPGEGENLRFFVKLTDQICVRKSIKIQ